MRGEKSISEKSIWSPVPQAGGLNRPLSERALLFTLLFFTVFSASGQTLSTSQILASALEAPALSRQQRQLDFLEKTNHDLPWVDKMEIRTETDEMDWERQEYLFRLSPNSTEERGAQRKFHRENIRLAEIERENILHDELMERYFLLAEWHHLTIEKELWETQKLVAQDRLAVLRKLAAAEGKVDLSVLLSAEEEFYAIERSTMDIERKILRLRTRLGMADSEQLIFDNILNVNELRNNLPLLLSPSANDPEAQERQAEIDRSMAEYELEEAGTKRFLDYVQTKYSGRDNLNFSQELSFGMGFNIPHKNSQRLNLNELALERIENENRLEAYLLRRAERMTEARQKIDLLFAKYNLARQQFADSQLAFSLENYPQTAGAEPLVLLKIKAAETKRQLDLAALEKDIFMAYLELLELTGKVVERPLRNYLTVEREPLKN